MVYPDTIFVSEFRVSLPQPPQTFGLIDKWILLPGFAVQFYLELLRFIYYRPGVTDKIGCVDAANFDKDVF